MYKGVLSVSKMENGFSLHLILLGGYLSCDIVQDANSPDPGPHQGRPLPVLLDPGEASQLVTELDHLDILYCLLVTKRI